MSVLQGEKTSKAPSNKIKPRRAARVDAGVSRNTGLIALSKNRGRYFAALAWRGLSMAHLTCLR
jgi:hypothetical protein